MTNRPTTTQLGGIGRYTMSLTLSDLVRASLGQFEDDYNVEELTDAFRVEINKGLEGTGISLHGDEFIGTVPVVEHSVELILVAVNDADLDSLLEAHEVQQ